MKYTKQELNGKISSLNDMIDQKKRQRTELSQQINQLKKEVEYWKSIDKSQLKLF